MYNKMILFLISGLIINTHSILSQSFNGNYTIGGSNPDFNSVQEAADSLLSTGVSGPVTFNIRNGVYVTNGGSERALYISDNIQGASATNYITFQADIANGAYVDSVILKRTSGSDEDGWVALIRCNFITLRGLTFEYAYADTSSNGIDNYRLNVKFQPAQGSSLDSIVVNNCRFISSGNYFPYTALKFAGGGINIFIENNLFRRAGNGLNIERCNGCPPFNDIIIRNNTFLRLNTFNDIQNSPRGTAIYVSNGSGYTITGNNLDYEAATGLFGITVIGSDVNISGNRIHNVSFQQFSFDSFWGLHLRSTGGDWLVSNNMISNIRKHAVGIHLENSSNIKIYNNTVVLTFVRFERQRALELLNVSDIDIKNNIFVVNANNYDNGQIIRGIGTNTNITADYNLLYSERFHIYFNNTDYDSLTAWQSAGYDANSRTFLPEFVTTEPYSDLHLGYCSLGNEQLWGIPLTEVSLDFDGDIRDSMNPYMGADEVDSFRPAIFTPLSITPLNDAGIHFTSGDLDNDGDDDIAVVNDAAPNGSEDISLFINNGQGIFSAPTHIAFGNQPTIVRAADVDGDNFTDLLVAGNNDMMVRWGTGVGNFDPVQNLSLHLQVTDFVLADLDNDGDLDIAEAHQGTVGVQNGEISVRKNDGNRILNTWDTATGSSHPSSIIAAELSGDGFLDLVISDYIEGTVNVVLNKGVDGGGFWNGIQDTADVYTTGLGSGPLHANLGTGDFDSDGDNDILLGKWDFATDSLIYLRNDGNCQFTVEYLSIDDRRQSHSFSTLDYENDGYPDFISATDQNDLILYRNDGIGNYEIQRLCQSSNFGALALTTVTGNFNGDSFTDFAVLTRNEFGVMFNLNYTVGIGGKNTFPQDLPIGFQMQQNYPNPFNPVTTIEFILAKSANVKIDIFNMLGQHLQTILNGDKISGKHKIQFDASSFSSGTYIYRIESEGIIKSGKMVLIR